MPKTVMVSATVVCLMAAVITSGLYAFSDSGICLTSAITFGITAYHFGIRLLVGTLYNAIMKNHADYNRTWFRVYQWEEKLYRLLRVKKWKDKLPTFAPESYSLRKHTLDEIAQTMCQSELVHETNIILSFMPLMTVRWFGAFYVILLTSLCGAGIDMVFVIMQRYNRVRVIKIVRKKEAPE